MVVGGEQIAVEYRGKGVCLSRLTPSEGCRPVDYREHGEYCCVTGYYTVVGTIGMTILCIVQSETFVQ